MKACALQIERLKVISDQLEQLQVEEQANAQQLASYLADARIYLHEISMRCKTKYLKLVETTSQQLEQLRSDGLVLESAEGIEQASQTIKEFLGQTELVTSAPQEE
ncbi:hypothetical protein TH61_01435 [Rufibacter sp. DG15C]|uniref:hypothetical protein n=1 Tax=Rufibacter sp. DG15C TaxID=1379909 RepID=UPI00078B4253|nr:hypothetical protein [Rufibacter sp. DG15C]AMM50107.1 hypothetical protein TH61_01435 [Rufibacter sp. DG15C]